MALDVSVSGFKRSAEACNEKHLDCNDVVNSVNEWLKSFKCCSAQLDVDETKSGDEKVEAKKRSHVTSLWLDQLQQWRQLHLRQQQFNSDMHRDTDDDRCNRALELDITHDVDKLRLACFAAKHNLADV